MRVRVLCVVLMLVGGAIAQRWVTPAETTNFRYTRFDGEYFPGTGKVYFLGGRLGDMTTTGAIWSFDPVARTYTNTGAVMPLPISNYDICLLRDNYDLAQGDTYGLYVVGGRKSDGTNSDSVQVYYPRTNRVRVLPTDNFPGRINISTIYAALGAVAAGNKIYVMGGFDPVSYVVTNLCYVFDPFASAGSRWTQLPYLGFARSYVAGAVIDDSLVYAIGGDTANAIVMLQARPYVERLNTRNLAAGWVRVRDMQMACGETRAYSFQRSDSLLGFSRQIVVAGTGQWPLESAHCRIYRVATDSWYTFPPLDSARRNHAGAYIPGNSGATGVPGIWVWGGRKVVDNVLLATPEYYALGLNVGVTRIVAPTGGVDSGATVTPACSVYNYGAVNATYKVRMRIGSGYTDSATVTNHAVGTRIYVTFPNWTANLPRGTYAMACSTRCGNDLDESNDKQTGTVTVNVRDVGTRVIVVPTGALDSVATLVPACSVYNYGTTTESYAVRMKIGTGYDSSASVSGHAPGTMQYVTFPAWTVGPRGVYAVACSTQLATDMYRSNDRMFAQATIRVQDVSATAILAPSGTVPPNQVVTPRLTVKNMGTSPATFDAQFVINSGGSPVYTDTETVTALAGGAEATVSFSKTWTATPVGSYTTVAWTMLADVNPANDTIRGSFSVREGGGTYPWQPRTPMPAGAKPVKDGAWLAYDTGMALVYASRGNKQPDFFSYNAAKDSWKALAPWLPGTEGKLPQKGSAGCADGAGHIYATKGNNTQGFYAYDATANVWTQKSGVPLGLSNKKVKGGTSIVCVRKGGVGTPYLLKGYKNEFYKYNVAGDSWTTLAPAPGATVKWDKGSWLVYDLKHTIYAHKAKYHEFYSYNTETDSWNPTALVGMPIPGSGGSKKSKDGGCATYVWPTSPDTIGAIYAFKGGNTIEWWKYSILANSWAEKETIPKGAFKKKVKAGASVTTVPLATDPGTPVEVPALKGNKTNELWVYTTAAAPAAGSVADRDGVTAEKRLLNEPFLTLVPNPLSGRFVTLRYSLPGSGPAMVRVYDVTGRAVLPASLITGRAGTALLDLHSLSAGVYLLKVEDAGFVTVRKLVVER